MRDYKNIDRIFQEKLKDFEVFPPNKSWDFIEKGLVVAPKKRRLSFWLRISSIAALFVLLFSVGTIYLLPDSNFSKNFLFNDNVKEASETILTTVQKESATVKPKKSVLIESGLKENNRTIADINRKLASELQASEIPGNCTHVIYRPFTVETLGIIVAWLLIGLMMTGSAALFWVSQR